MTINQEDGKEQWGSWSSGNDSDCDSRFVDSRAVRTGGAAARPWRGEGRPQPVTRGRKTEGGEGREMLVRRGTSRLK